MFISWKIRRLLRNPSVPNDIQKICYWIRFNKWAHVSQVLILFLPVLVIFPKSYITSPIYGCISKVVSYLMVFKLMFLFSACTPQIPSVSILHNHPNNIRWRVQIVQLLIMLFFSEPVLLHLSHIHIFSSEICFQTSLISFLLSG
jgi:hypothetical protein